MTSCAWYCFGSSSLIVCSCFVASRVVFNDDFLVFQYLMILFKLAIFAEYGAEGDLEHCASDASMACCIVFAILFSSLAKVAVLSWGARSAIAALL